jgi:hypothetical protein
MTKYYSKTTCGFYDSAINATMPPDAVTISDDTYSALFSAQSTGQVIQSDSNGNPEAVAFTPSSAQVHAALQASAQSALTKTDTSMLRVQEAITLGLTTATTADVVAFVQYRKALRAIINGTDTTSTSLPAEPAYPANT